MSLLIPNKSLPPVPAKRSPSLEDTVLDADERRKRRRLSNRESARRSRLRKQQHLDELVAEAARLRGENGQIAVQVAALSDQYVSLESENSVLRAQMAELAERLRSMNMVVRAMEELGGSGTNLSPNTPALPQSDQMLLRCPWQMPMITAGDMPFY